ncbi:hypothetical protein Patl1_34682 [Pistacia atlantica]|uniref:Uncharacterized protein n=1 Tax=Pistacia atlantica TaxID=434234 RepID=A0ACC0ZWN5_9ROSI|nr:hypothetical protein Patl1_34682 [Pistacia atlantica]
MEINPNTTAENPDDPINTNNPITTDSPHSSSANTQSMPATTYTIEAHKLQTRPDLARYPYGMPGYNPDSFLTSSLDPNPYLYPF